MIVASQWVLILYFGYTSVVIGTYTTEADCDRAKEMAIERWVEAFEGKRKAVQAVCLPIGTIEDSGE